MQTVSLCYNSQHRLGRFVAKNEIRACNICNGRELCDCKLLKNLHPQIYEGLYQRPLCETRELVNLELPTKSVGTKACFVCTNEECQMHYVATINLKTYHGSGCSHCASVSKFHDETRTFLENFKLNGRKLIFDKEKSYEDLIGDSGWKLLPFGFIIGENSKARFELQKKYYRMKNDYCKENKIHLIRISYTRREDMEPIMKGVFKRWSNPTSNASMKEFYGTCSQY